MFLVSDFFLLQEEPHQWANCKSKSSICFWNSGTLIVHKLTMAIRGVGSLTKLYNICANIEEMLAPYGMAKTWLCYTHTHTHPFKGPLSGTTRVSRYQKGKTNLDFTEARESEWQWHQLGRMQVCTVLHTDSHASTSPLLTTQFLQAGCPSCRPTNSIKALKA